MVEKQKERTKKNNIGEDASHGLHDAPQK